MKFVDNTLFIEWQEALQSGIPEDTLKSANKRGSWHFIDDPEDKRKVLIGYEKLKDTYKEKIQKRFGNPYEYLAKTPIRNLVTKDTEAEKFYLAYKYEGSTSNNSLPIEHVAKYTLAASWLNMLVKFNNDKKQIKKLLNLTIDQFYVNVLDIIKADKIDLPGSYKRLVDARKNYELKGYTSLIDWRFGNKLAAKVKDEVAESVLLEMISHHNQYDDVFIEMKYNTWATEKGYKTIDRATVGNWRRKNGYLVTGTREGNAAWYDKFGQEIKGKRPSTPLYMVESDDNHIDLLFIDPDDKTSHKHYHRFKAIVVTDSYNDYPLGYAYAEELTTEVVRAAYLNAMHHIKELTGGWYFPHETKTDRWALSELQPFYEGIGHYYPTPVGSKRRGYLEQFFGSALWKRSLKIGANNYTGNNITAAKRGVNTEVLELQRKERATIDEAPRQIENFFHRLRTTPGENGKSKQDEWLEAWVLAPESKKRPATDEQFLLKFGILHRPKNGRAITITKGGVEPQIRGIQYMYSIPPAYFLQSIGKQVNVIYDPCDMNRVLVTDFENLRVMGTSQALQPRAMADYQTGDRTILNALLDEKRAAVEHVAAKSARRKQVLSDSFIDAETLLQAGVMVKELKQQAEISYQQRAISNGTYDPLDDM